MQVIDGHVVVEEPWDCLVVVTAGLHADPESAARIYRNYTPDQLPAALGPLVARAFLSGLEKVVHTGEAIGYQGFLTPAIAAGYLELLTQPE